MGWVGLGVWDGSEMGLAVTVCLWFELPWPRTLQEEVRLTGH